MKKFDILEAYKLNNTIFTTKDFSLIWNETDLNTVKSRINYYVKTGKLLSLRKGIFSKNNNYDKYELATKIFKPAYISLETVLQKEGIITQYYNTIFAISYLSRTIKYGNQEYTYRKIKDIALFNNTGLETIGNYYIAIKERAFLDCLYLYKNYHFDNLNSIDWKLCDKLVKIYENKELINTLNSYKNAKNQ